MVHEHKECNLCHQRSRDEIGQDEDSLSSHTKGSLLELLDTLSIHDLKILTTIAIMKVVLMAKQTIILKLDGRKPHLLML